MITIFGYGSLMSEESTKITMPTATNFRKGILEGYRRIYNLVSVSGIRNGTVNMATKEIAALSIAVWADGRVFGCIFEIPHVELAGYLEREHRYKPVEVKVWDCAQESYVTALTVVENMDADYKSSLKGGDAEYFERVGKYYSESLWERTDIFPMKKYMLNCAFAANLLGGIEWVNNYLDNTYLSDRSTTLRSYFISKRNSTDEDVLLAMDQLAIQ